MSKVKNIIIQGALATGCIAIGIMSMCAGASYISTGFDIATDLIVDFNREED